MNILIKLLVFIIKWSIVAYYLPGIGYRYLKQKRIEANESIKQGVCIRQENIYTSMVNAYPIPAPIKDIGKTAYIHSGIPDIEEDYKLIADDGFEEFQRALIDYAGLTK